MFRDQMEKVLASRIHQRHRELENVDFETIPSWIQNEVRVGVAMHRDLVRSAHYFLEVDQVSELGELALDEKAFPACPHPLTFIEFNGLLRYNYSHVMTEVAIDPETGKVSYANPFKQEGGASYRGVLIRTNEKDGWIQAHWYDQRGNIFSVGITRDDWPKTDFSAKGFVPTSVAGVSPLTSVAQAAAEHLSLDGSFEPQDKKDFEPPEWRAEESEHLRKMYHVTVNLLHFLMAENLVFVKIKPSDRSSYRELRSLPKSERPYRILSFQAARYRYLEKRSEPTGRHVSVVHDVRGFFRHLHSERFERDAEGHVRTVWVRAHQRGLGNEIYRPTLRVGHVGAHLLNYDEFIRKIEK